MGQCPECGTEHVEGENFCDNCGHKYPSPTQSEPELPSELETVNSVNEESTETPIRPSAAIYFQSDSDEIAIRFEDTPRTIGRNDILEFLNSRNINALEVSQLHCTIFKENDEYYIEDGITAVQNKLSTNGTVVNGNNITGQGKIKLNNNDKIWLARKVSAVFRID